LQGLEYVVHFIDGLAYFYNKFHVRRDFPHWQGGSPSLSMIP
jgi:hypothetical protein